MRHRRGYGQVTISSRTTSARARSSTNHFSDDIGASMAKHCLGRQRHTCSMLYRCALYVYMYRCRSSPDLYSDDIGGSFKFPLKCFVFQEVTVAQSPHSHRTVTAQSPHSHRHSHLLENKAFPEHQPIVIKMFNLRYLFFKSAHS